MKNEMMIILKPDDSMEKMAYIKGESLWQAVDGSIEHFLETKLRTLSGNLLTVDFYCNEEFAVIDDEKFEKLNALASLISGQEIRGNAGARRANDIVSENQKHIDAKAISS